MITTVVGSKVVITVSIKDLYYNYVNCKRDIFWDTPSLLPKTNFAEIMMVFLNEDIPTIRTYFSNLMVPFILPIILQMEGDKPSFYEFEVRIHNRQGKLVGVIVDNEIDF